MNKGMSLSNRGVSHTNRRIALVNRRMPLTNGEVSLNISTASSIKHQTSPATRRFTIIVSSPDCTIAPR